MYKSKAHYRLVSMVYYVPCNKITKLVFERFVLSGIRLEWGVLFLPDLEFPHHPFGKTIYFFFRLIVN
jgi:hypothetical protein